MFTVFFGVASWPVGDFAPTCVSSRETPGLSFTSPPNQLRIVATVSPGPASMTGTIEYFDEYVVSSSCVSRRAKSPLTLPRKRIRRRLRSVVRTRKSSPVNAPSAASTCTVTGTIVSGSEIFGFMLKPMLWSWIIVNPFALV